MFWAVLAANPVFWGLASLTALLGFSWGEEGGTREGKGGSVCRKGEWKVGRERVKGVGAVEQWRDSGTE